MAVLWCLRTFESHVEINIPFQELWSKKHIIYFQTEGWNYKWLVSINIPSNRKCMSLDTEEFKAQL